jgi:RND family efflux transporter MFP subunit
MKKVVLGIVVAGLLAAGGWQGYRQILVAMAAKRKANRPDLPVAVETQPIRQGTIRDIGVFTGSLVPQSQFIVAPKVSGWVKKLLVDIGDTVRRNDLIALLNDEEFTRQVEQARAELQVAKANVENCTSDLELAKREYERVQALREKQIASAAEFDTSAAAYAAGQTRLKVSLAQVAQKEAALKAAELQLSYAQVRAFWEEGDPNRVVGERFVDEGTLVQMNQPIVSILENDPLVAVVFVVERDYPKMHIGQQAVVTTDAYPGTTFTGDIQRIAPLLKETSRQARVEIEIANRDRRLKPGMFIRAQVQFDQHEQATLIPLSALVRRGDKEGVFLADTGALRVRFVPVTTGIVSGEQVEVADPPLAGVVVTLGNHLLEDGSRITLPDVARASDPGPLVPDSFSGGGR